MGQSLINKHFEKFCWIQACHFFGKWQVMLHQMCLQINVAYSNSLIMGRLISGLP